MEFPIHEVAGNKERDRHFAAVHFIGCEFGFSRGGGFGNWAGTNGIIAPFVLPNEGIGEVIRVNRVLPIHFVSPYKIIGTELEDHK